MRPIKACALILLPLCCAPAFAQTEGTAASGGVNIHYLDSGAAPTRRVLVLIPGWSTGASIWREQMAQFAPAMRVVAIDPRGQGASGKTQDGNTPEQRARDYEQVFARLGLRDIVLVGWSQGVQDVAAYAQEFGCARIAGFVLVDAAVSDGAASAAENPAAAQTLLSNIDIYARHKREYLEGMMQAIFTRKMSAAERGALVETGMQTPTDSGIAMLVADMLGRDRTPALKKMDRPTFIVASAASPELARQKAETAVLPHGGFIAVEHAGHGVFVDQPAAFDRILSDFISSLPR